MNTLLITLLAAGATGGIAAYWAKMEERKHWKRTVESLDNKLDRVIGERARYRRSILDLLKVAEAYQPRTNKMKKQRMDALCGGRHAL